MSNVELLDNVKHKDLKVDPRYRAEYGDSINQALVFPSEFAELQKEYPILLKKDKETGQFMAVVLLGLDFDENLFLDDSGWNAHYVPAIQARGPFSIGLRREETAAQKTVEAMIQVDRNDPRVREEGMPVFLEHGGYSPYLKQISKVLKVIHEGWAVAKTLYPTLDEMGLIEPVTINVDLSDNQTYSITNYFSISEEKLAQLSGDQLKKLNEVGYLESAYHLLASQTNISRLIGMKNRKRAKESA